MKAYFHFSSLPIINKKTAQRWAVLFLHGMEASFAKASDGRKESMLYY
ncbi:hypothetical protein KJ590_00675 [Patescibacteria group bacterium]|nr:hypothetical protein [Patescibacteria group bacterium]